MPVNLAFCRFNLVLGIMKGDDSWFYMPNEPRRPFHTLLKNHPPWSKLKTTHFCYNLKIVLYLYLYFYKKVLDDIPYNFLRFLSSGWFQPIWKILLQSNWKSSPSRGEHKKNETYWNHQPVIGFSDSSSTNTPMPPPIFSIPWGSQAKVIGDLKSPNLHHVWHLPFPLCQKNNPQAVVSFKCHWPTKSNKLTSICDSSMRMEKRSKKFSQMLVFHSKLYHGTTRKKVWWIKFHRFFFPRKKKRILGGK